MILSDASIRRAVAEGDIAIDPAPESAQLQTSAVDMFLGHAFRVWDLPRLATPGLSPVLDLAEQRFVATANSFSIQAELARWQLHPEAVPRSTSSPAVPNTRAPSSEAALATGGAG